MMVIGLPCNIQAIKKTQLFNRFYKESNVHDKMGLDDVDWFEKIDMTIGMFCMKGFHKACDVCSDFTAIFADISIGLIDSHDKKYCVIVRSDRGSEFFDDVISGGVLKLESNEEYYISKIHKFEHNKSETFRKNSVEYFEKLPLLFEDINNVGLKEVFGITTLRNYFHLDFNVISEGLCISCGACIASCPNKAIKEINGKIIFDGECFGGACGACYISCPRTDLSYGTDNIHLMNKFVGDVRDNEYYIVSLNNEITNNDIFTTLMEYSLKNKVTDKVLLTKGKGKYSKKDNCLYYDNDNIEIFEMPFGMFSNNNFDHGQGDS